MCLLGKKKKKDKKSDQLFYVLLRYLVKGMGWTATCHLIIILQYCNEETGRLEQSVQKGVEVKPPYMVFTLMVADSCIYTSDALFSISFLFLCVCVKRAVASDMMPIIIASHGLFFWENTLHISLLKKRKTKTQAKEESSVKHSLTTHIRIKRNPSPNLSVVLF